MPVVWLVSLSIYATFTKHSKRRRLVLKVITGLLLFFTNPFLLNEAWLAWEVPPAPLTGSATYDVGILLTGITSKTKSPHDRVYLERGADRVFYALWLYKYKKIKKIIISGGSGSLQPVYGTEATELRTILLTGGVPAADILVEDKSRNTRENALFTAALLKQHPEMRSFILITSAFHMRRSLGCFAVVGVVTSSFPVDYYSTDRSYYPNKLIIPSEEAFAGWHLLLHELTGYITYKLLGYS